MQMYEIEPLISNSYKKNKDNWEQARLIAYVIALTNSTKKLKPNDIIRFSWDEEADAGNTSISNDDIRRLKKKTKQYITHN